MVRNGERNETVEEMRELTHAYVNDEDEAAGETLRQLAVKLHFDCDEDRVLRESTSELLSLITSVTMRERDRLSEAQAGDAAHASELAALIDDYAHARVTSEQLLHFTSLMSHQRKQHGLINYDDICST